MLTNLRYNRLKREIIRRLHSAVAPKILGEASVVEKMKIICRAGVGCCGDDLQGGFGDDRY